MANDAPSSFTNLPDSMFTLDAFRAATVWVGYYGMQSARYLYEKLAEGGKAAGDTRNASNYPHAHAEQSSTCGIVVRRSIVSHNLGGCTSDLDATAIDNVTTMNDNTWFEIARYRTCVGGFRKVKCEVEYHHGIGLGNAKVAWKISSHTANDSFDADVAAHTIVEATGTMHSTSQGYKWHTISGVQDGAGSTLAKLTIGDPVSATDPGKTTSWREFVVSARPSYYQATSFMLYVRNVHIWEALTTD